MVFNATFNNISVISWRSVLLVEETRVLGENHRPVANHRQTLSHNVSDTPYLRADCVMKRIHLNNSTSMSFDSPGITHTAVTYTLGTTKSYNWDNLKQTLFQDNHK
jgi:hypothetical protein